MTRRYFVFIPLLFLCLIIGCFRSSTKVERGRESGMPSFVQQNNPVGCDCAPIAERFARAELGLDPTQFGSWQTPSDLLTLLKTDSASNGSEVIVRNVNECLDELAARPEPSPSEAMLLIHPKGHVYLLLGTVMLGEVLTYQVIHGDSAVWLIDKKTLERAEFTEAWQFNKKTAGIPIAVGGGVLTIDQHYFNFGKVTPSTALEAVVSFKNTGDKPLIFTKPEVTCACTVAEGLADLELPPGESKDMKVSFQTSAGSSERHPVFVKVFEKGTGIPKRIEILLMASQQQSMSIEPMGLGFGRVVKGETYERTVNISEVPTDRFTILKVDSENQPIRGEFETLGERGGLKTYQVKAIFSPDGNLPDREKNFFTVETDSLLRPKLQIPYSYSVMPDVYSEPSVISLGSTKAGTTTEETIRITVRGKDKFQCEIKSVPEGCEVKIVKEGNPTELLFTATPKQPGIWQGKLVIVVTISEREEILEIDCVGYVN